MAIVLSRHAQEMWDRLFRAAWGLSAQKSHRLARDRDGADRQSSPAQRASSAARFSAPSICSANIAGRDDRAPASASAAARRRFRPRPAAHSHRRIGDEQCRSSVASGKNEAVWPSAPMPSTATSSGHGSARSSSRAPRRPLPRRSPSAIERRRTAQRLPLPCSSCRAHQPRIGARRGLRHEALVDQRHRRPCPSRSASRDSVAQELRRRGAAGNGEKAGPRACDRTAPGVPATVPPSASASSPRVANSCQFGCRVAGGQALSCHVRPSRSISAIEADGPQVPAV